MPSSLGACRGTRSGFERPFFRLAASGCIDDKTNIACFAVFARRKNDSLSGRRRNSPTDSQAHKGPDHNSSLEILRKMVTKCKNQIFRGPSKNCFLDENERTVCCQGGRSRWPEAVLFTVEERFWPDNAGSRQCSRSQSKWILRGSLNCAPLTNGPR
jgi:hypothetical protein